MLTHFINSALLIVEKYDNELSNINWLKRHDASLKQKLLRIYVN